MRCVLLIYWIAIALQQRQIYFTLFVNSLYVLSDCYNTYINTYDNNKRVIFDIIAMVDFQ